LLAILNILIFLEASATREFYNKEELPAIPPCYSRFEIISLLKQRSITHQLKIFLIFFELALCLKVCCYSLSTFTHYMATISHNTHVKECGLEISQFTRHVKWHLPRFN